MGLLGTLLGRKRRAPVSWTEALAAIGRAAPQLQDDLETKPTGQAGLIIRLPSRPPQPIPPPRWKRP